MSPSSDLPMVALTGMSSVKVRSLFNVVNRYDSYSARDMAIFGASVAGVSGSTRVVFVVGVSVSSWLSSCDRCACNGAVKAFVRKRVPGTHPSIPSCVRVTCGCGEGATNKQTIVSLLS